MAEFTSLTSKFIALPMNNIDTDQIIPARFLKATDKTGMGAHLFADWRYDGEGQPRPDFFLNQPRAQEAHILLAGDNFGCGSSREHAPWALVGFGFRAVISTSFADIFCSNALKNGLLPVKVDAETHQSLLDLLEESPEVQITIDLEHQVLRLPAGQTVVFPVDPFARACLLRGVDELGYLLGFETQISAFEAIIDQAM
jgi:3-isopropylmalate/(R)-2-methylmalate dehydratase small subunit